MGQVIAVRRDSSNSSRRRSSSLSRTIFYYSRDDVSFFKQAASMGKSRRPDSLVGLSFKKQWAPGFLPFFK